MKNTANRALLLSATLMLLAGCSKPPQQAIDAVIAGVDQITRNPDAATYAPDALRAAQDQLTELQDEVKVQAKKPALFRRYRKTEELVAEAQVAVDQARAATELAKEKVRAEAQKLIAEATASLPALGAKAATARRLRGSKLDSAAVAEGFAEAQAMLAEAQADLGSGSFAAANAKANAAHGRLAAVELQLDEAILLGRGR